MAKITIVDEDDNVIGAEERSVNVKDNLEKWDQPAGGHVDEGEGYTEAAIRETKEELGVDLKDLKEIGKFYIEREGPDGYLRRFQKVYVGRWDGSIDYDKSEVADVRWLILQQIEKWSKEAPQDFTKNFPKTLAVLSDYIGAEQSINLL